MISDVLYEAVEGIDYYLNDPIFKGVYVGRLRTELMAMRDHTGESALIAGSFLWAWKTR